MIYFDWLDSTKQKFDAKKAVETFSFTPAKDKTVPVFNETEMNALYAAYETAKKDGSLYKTQFTYDKGWADSNSANGLLSPKARVDEWNKKHAANFSAPDAKTKSFYGYKYDSAFGLLITKVLPDGFGLKGFIFAALLGAARKLARRNAQRGVHDIHHRYLQKIYCAFSGRQGSRARRQNCGYRLRGNRLFGRPRFG